VCSSDLSPRKVKDSDQDQNNGDFYRQLALMEGQIVDVADTGTVDTEFTVPHGMNRVPLSVSVMVKSSQTDAYLMVKPSGTAWTKRNVYLKCNTANANIRLRLI
jgi:hypothetical protein